MSKLPYLKSIFCCLHLFNSKQYHYNSTGTIVKPVTIQNLANYKIQNRERERKRKRTKESEILVF